MAEKKTGEEELEIVGPGAADDESSEAPPSPASETKESKAKEEADDENEGDEEEQELGHSETDDEEKPAKRSTRRQRDRESRIRDKKELALLRIRNEQLEQRFGHIEQRQVQNEKVAIEQRIEALKSQINIADEVMGAAIDNKQGKDYREASKIKDQLATQLNRLVSVRETLEETEPSEEERAAAQQTPKVPIEVQVNAKVWRKENAWWKPQGRDEDSTEVRRIDAELVEEGYDPRSDDYWNELTSRVKEALPHRYEDSDGDVTPPRNGAVRKNGNGQRKNGGGPRFSTAGREAPLKPNQVHISAARKAAMVEAGVWDDPILRNRFLKQYQRYDRENPSRNS